MKRYFHTIVASLYFFLCLFIGSWAGQKEPKSVQITFVFFGFLFFLYGYLSYFTPVVHFSQAEQIYERKKLRLPAFRSKRTALLVCFGLLCFGGLLWLFQQRMQ